MGMLLFWTVLSFLSICYVIADKCESPFVGVDCRLECHCLDNKCDETGNCIAPKGCIQNKFGSLCQYEKVKMLDGPTWLRDDNNSTCNPDEVPNPTTVKIKTTFTWARMIFRKPGKGPRDISVSFDNDIPCQNQTSFDISSDTTDIYCFNGKPVTSITLLGQDIGYLCTLYISGGRNTALRQYTNMTSEMTRAVNQGLCGSQMAVDGGHIDFGNDYCEGCAHTDINDPYPKFALIFERPHFVHTIRLFARTGAVNLLRRLLHYELRLVDVHGRLLFRYKDNSPNETPTFTLETGVVDPISKVFLEPDCESPFLNFCEIELYGDVICENGTYGHACEHRCDFCPEGACRVETGACTKQCPPGKRYLGCDTDCEKGWYGPGCLKKCITECGRGVPQCTVDTTFCKCPDTFYGPNCSRLCSAHCKNRLCHSQTGDCLLCFPGYTGKQCSNNCEKTFFGPNCLNRCSDKCKDKLCHPVIGTCLACPSGFEGEKCTEVVIQDKGPSPVFLVILVLGLLVIATLVLIRRKNVEDQPEEPQIQHVEEDYQHHEQASLNFYY